MFGYCIYKKESMLRIGEVKNNVWMGKRTDYFGSGTITNKIYSKDPNPNDDFKFGPKVQ